MKANATSTRNYLQIRDQSSKLPKSSRLHKTPSLFNQTRKEYSHSQSRVK
uniref:Uncharacterized protein n=1 Tax=Arundo donax TaxID=35708 RepID=A0A0A9BZY0_ARUDO